jgi:hypothetical protein
MHLLMFFSQPPGFFFVYQILFSLVFRIISVFSVGVHLHSLIERREREREEEASVKIFYAFGSMLKYDDDDDGVMLIESRIVDI